MHANVRVRTGSAAPQSHLCDVRVRLLQAPLLQHLEDGPLQHAVVLVRHHHVGEQVPDDVLEQLHVIDLQEEQSGKWSGRAARQVVRHHHVGEQVPDDVLEQLRVINF